MTSKSLIISGGMSLIWLSALTFDVLRQPRLGHHWYIYKLVMLTNLNFVLDAIYSVLVLLGYKCNKMKGIADFMHFTSVFPVAIVTCGLFWGLYTVDPELVMPDWIAKLIPSWLNHITHTFPVIFIFLDSYLYKRTIPTKLACWQASATLVFIYFMIIGYVKFYDGYWLYPLLELFSLKHFVISYVLSFLGFFLLTQLAIMLNCLLHKRFSSPLPKEKIVSSGRRKNKKQ